ncbi:MAG: DNA mismatch repair endonuclease MutL, partial [Oscillospiraceae bacterium]|nr:DNA mismatch repair endonuclease MutL [Oscillospiraceae bacterium]
MPHIQQLAAHVADLIAAGEVVERPASVVKELVENAVDAGATAVVVEIQRGGMGLIRVTDDGCGIAPEELPTAFLRHATSKLRTPEDLGKIGTLGFRGEALAAVSAVSRVDILTRQKGAGSGASLHLEGGVPGRVEEAGAPEGTTILVRDLFYNTPARLKFMKKDSAETAAVAGLMQHLALSHPGISFKFIKDGAETLHTPGDGKPDSAVYAALGRDFARTLIPVEGRGGDVAVSGFVTQPLMGRGSRSMQVFFVNGRFIKSQLLTAALEEGYRNQI